MSLHFALFFIVLAFIAGAVAFYKVGKKIGLAVAAEVAKGNALVATGMSKVTNVEQEVKSDVAKVEQIVEDVKKL